MSLALRCALLGLVSLALFGSTSVSATAGTVANPNTPADGSTTSEEMCLLDSLTFTNGLSLVEAFVPNRFHYTCKYTPDFKGTTQVIPHLEDNGSSAEVTFNGAKLNFRSNSPPNALSNGGDNGQAPKSPILSATGSTAFTLVSGKNTIIVGVGCNGFGLPETCYYQYTITCDQSSIIGDPQFVGLRGQSYQVHGVSGEVYNIVSDVDLQYNAKFVFLDHGECPTVDGKQQRKGCWSHPGSYLGELGLKTRAGDRLHLVTGRAAVGFQSVTVNGKEVAVGETVVLAGDMGSLSRNSTHLTSISAGKWEFAFENSDLFVNQRVRVMDARGLRSHGLLGQTWRETTYANAIKYVAGQVDDYVVRDQDVFGDSFVFNQFN